MRGSRPKLGPSEQEKMESIKECCYEIVLNNYFVSPERLLTDSEMRDMLHSPLYKEHLVGVVIDEAHCVKKWLAHSFIISIKLVLADKLLATFRFESQVCT